MTKLVGKDRELAIARLHDLLDPAIRTDKDRKLLQMLKIESAKQSKDSLVAQSAYFWIQFDRMRESLRIALDLADQNIAINSTVVDRLAAKAQLLGLELEFDKRVKQANARKAAKASHAKHDVDKQAVREWYAEHRKQNPKLSKDDAAKRIQQTGVVKAAFRTIRGYLNHQ